MAQCIKSIRQEIDRENVQPMKIGFLPFILLIVPVAEISAFVLIGDEIGLLATIGLILFTAILGSILLRIEGFRTFRKISEKVNTGQIPGEELGNGAMILVAGVFLLTPGFITDSLGFSLFIPAVRKIIWNFLASKITLSTGPEFADSNQNRPFESDVVDLNPEDFQETGNSDSPWNKNNRFPQGKE